MKVATVDGVLDLLTLAEATDQLRISRYLLNRLVQSGELPTVKIGTRRLVTRSALQDFVIRRQTEGV